MKTTYRRATLLDIDTICDVHKRNYPGYLLTSKLCISTLKRYYTDLIHQMEYSYVAVQNKQVVSVIILGTQGGEVVRRLKKEVFWEIVSILIRNPMIAFSVILKKFVRRSIKSSKLRLFTIVSCDNFHGNLEFLSFVEKSIAGLHQDYGLTVARRNKRAQRFYLKNNMKIINENIMILEYKKDLRL